MSELILNMRVVGKSTLLPLQKGILQSFALKMLYEDLKCRFGYEYILTYGLNQVILENFFGVIRSTGGGLHDHPDRQQFTYRLRKQIIGHNEGVLSSAANVEINDTPDLEGSYSPLSDIEYQDETLIESDLEILADEGLGNLAGYICFKMKEDVPNISVRSPPGGHDDTLTWVNYLSEGGLSKPTNEFMNQDGLNITTNYLQKLLDQS